MSFFLFFMLNFFYPCEIRIFLLPLHTKYNIHVDELSRHIEILLLDNDCVIVPGFGGFMAHHRVAECVEGMFYPPQRTLGFNAQLQLNDSLLAQSYVEAYDISYPEAVRRLESQVEEIKQRIAVEGEYEFHGIGLIRLDSDGRYLFEPCQAGLLTPSLYGFDSFCMDVLKENEAVSQDEATTLEVEEEEHKESQVLYLSIVKYAAAVILVLLAFTFSVLTGDRKNSDVLQCSVVNTQVLSTIMTSESTQKQSATEVKHEASNASEIHSPKPVEQTEESTEAVNPAKDASEQIKAEEAKKIADAKKAEEAKKIADAKKVEAAKNAEMQKSYYAIVLASKITRSGADEFVANLSKEGLREAAVYERGNMRRVVYGRYPSIEKANEALRKLRDKSEVFADAWAGEVKK